MEEIEKDEILERATQLKDNYFLFSIVVVDRMKDNKFEINYIFEHKEKNEMVNIRTFLSRDNPKIYSISNIFPAADYEEREAYDMFGIIFLGHNNLRRILLPEDWPFGYPLRKDFIVNDEVRNWTGTELRW
ncbi:MAG: NADH-quinone oxidoreductase subunit C [Conexivisphaerales archaeon]